MSVHAVYDKLLVLSVLTFAAQYAAVAKLKPLPSLHCLLLAITIAIT